MPSCIDPATGIWTDTNSMLLARSHHSATLLPDGKVLVVGGAVYSNKLRPSKRAEVYDPATGTWASTENMTEALVAPTAALLPDGNVSGGRGFPERDPGPSAGRAV